MVQLRKCRCLTMSKEKHWSKAEVEKLRQLLEAKTPLEVTTAQLNRTVDAVKNVKDLA